MALETRENKFIVNERFTSAYDIVPTLFDLLGVKFNENFYLGHSLFRPADLVYTENGVTKDMVVYYSNTGGLFGDNIYTFDLKTIITEQDYSSETVELLHNAHLFLSLVRRTNESILFILKIKLKFMTY